MYEKERVPVGIPVKKTSLTEPRLMHGGKDVRFQPAVWGLRMH